MRAEIKFTASAGLNNSTVQVLCTDDPKDICHSLYSFSHISKVAVKGKQDEQNFFFFFFRNFNLRCNRKSKLKGRYVIRIKIIRFNGYNWLRDREK